MITRASARRGQCGGWCSARTRGTKFATSRTAPSLTVEVLPPLEHDPLRLSRVDELRFAMVPKSGGRTRRVRQSGRARRIVALLEAVAEGHEDECRMEWYNDHRGSAGFGSHSPRRRKNRSPPFPLVRPDVSLRFSTACGFSLTKPFTGPSLSYFEGFDRGAHRAWRRILPCDHSR